MSTSKATAKEIHRAPYLLALIASRKWRTLGTVVEAVIHPKDDLLKTYIEEDILVHTGLPWLSQALENAINNESHASECTQEMVGFIWGEMQQKVQDGFSIFLPAAGTVRIFGENLKLSYIVMVPQIHQRPRLILNLLAKPDALLVLTTLMTGRSPCSLCSLIDLSHTSSIRSGRQILSKAPSGF